MIITHVGHAEFLLELESGVRIVTDPYDASCGYPDKNVRAEVALVSHGHHDHNAVEQVAGLEKVIDTAGEHTFGTDIHVTAYASYHDEVQGAKRGNNLLFCLETEGLKIVHLGDLGCVPEPEILKALKKADVLMIPVGGFFTIDGKQAKEIAEMLEPRVVIPMHYKTGYNESWPIAPVDDFVRLYEGDAEYLTQLRITEGDRECQPKLAVLNS